jgi:lipoyl(octanoyl) transferase
MARDAPQPADPTPVTDTDAIGWAVSRRTVDYPAALSAMEERTARIAIGEARQLVWLLEHPPLYTAGTSAREEDLIDAARFPVFPAGRGGQYTYHGPGQRVVYTMIDLRRRKADVRAFVTSLERWIILTLASFGITGEIRCGRVGVWVARERPGGLQEEDKIAAIGIRVRRWIAFHGFAVNVAPDLTHFAGIVPCGIAEHGVTSLRALGCDASLADVDAALRATFTEAMGEARLVEEPPPSGA